MATVGFVDFNGTDGLAWADSPDVPDSGEITVEIRNANGSWTTVWTQVGGKACP